jgi:hypothetical protein
MMIEDEDIDAADDEDDEDVEGCTCGGTESGFDDTLGLRDEVCDIFVLSIR